VLAFVRGGAALLRLETASGKSTVVRSGRTTLFQPDWSPDGSRIAGTRAGGELWQVNTDGSGLRRLAARRIRGELPRWSPDRGRVAFSFTPVNDPASFSVRILNLRSGRVRTVFEPRDGTGVFSNPTGGLAWSPDGRWLTVLRTIDVECVDDPTQERCEQAEVWIVSTTDNRRRRIFTGPQVSWGYGLDWRRAHP
jgi:Tol biopolymer transport system component